VAAEEDPELARFLRAGRFALGRLAELGLVRGSGVLAGLASSPRPGPAEEAAMATARRGGAGDSGDSARPAGGRAVRPWAMSQLLTVAECAATGDSADATGAAEGQYTEPATPSATTMAAAGGGGGGCCPGGAAAREVRFETVVEFDPSRFPHPGVALTAAWALVPPAAEQQQQQPPQPPPPLGGGGGAKDREALDDGWIRGEALGVLVPPAAHEHLDGQQQRGRAWPFAASLAALLRWEWRLVLLRGGAVSAGAGLGGLLAEAQRLAQPLAAAAGMGLVTVAAVLFLHGRRGGEGKR